MPAPELNARLALAMRTSPGMPVLVQVTGVESIRRYRAAIQFIKAADLVRLSSGAVGGHTAIEARQQFDLSGGMSYAEVIGGPVRTYDHSRYAGDDE